MRKFLLILFWYGWGHSLCGQSLFATLFVGANGYRGDLQPAVLSAPQLRPVIGFGFLYEIDPHWSAGINLHYGQTGGHDRYNLSNKDRNLQFVSDIFEFTAFSEYSILDNRDYHVVPFLHLGFGIFKFSPYLPLDNGNRINLFEYATEGQGFIDGKSPYALTSWCLPVGGGFQWSLHRNIRLAAKISYQFTGTDYLDDVSTTYVDENLMRQYKGQNGVNIAYRGNLLPGGAPYPAAGTPRGNPKNNDGYLLAGLSLRFPLDAKGRAYQYEYRPGKLRRHKTSCPSL
ncbi:MAG: hypothetical protein ACKO5C_02250 [Ferruginibacter sp.]